MIVSMILCFGSMYIHTFRARREDVGAAWDGSSVLGLAKLVVGTFDHDAKLE